MLIYVQTFKNNPMKKLFAILFIIFCSIAVNAQTLFYVEGQSTMTRDTGTASVLASMNHSFPKSGLGIFGFTLVSPSFAEAFVGPTYTFDIGDGAIMQIGSGVGFEKIEKGTPLGKSIRGMSYIYIEHDPLKMTKQKFQFLVDLEYLGSGPWYLSYATYNITNFVGVGIHTQKDAVLGGRVQIFPTKWLMLYGVFGHNFEANKLGGMAAVRASF
jgi:hypothetical protein